MVAASVSSIDGAKKRQMNNIEACREIKLKYRVPNLDNSSQKTVMIISFSKITYLFCECCAPMFRIWIAPSLVVNII